MIYLLKCYLLRADFTKDEHYSSCRFAFCTSHILFTDISSVCSDGFRLSGVQDKIYHFVCAFRQSDQRFVI